MNEIFSPKLTSGVRYYFTPQDEIEATRLSVRKFLTPLALLKEVISTFCAVCIGGMVGILLISGTDAFSDIVSMLLGQSYVDLAVAFWPWIVGLSLFSMLSVACQKAYTYYWLSVKSG